MTFLTVNQVADLLQLSRSKVYALVSSGELPRHKIGGSIRIKEDDLFSYLDGCRAQNADAPRRAPRPRLKHIRL
jgi:putative molybdopterin biosynthesis protein